MNKTITTYEIKQIRGHYEVYCHGVFICSGDSIRECEETISELAA